MNKFLTEFKEFAIKGNVVDMAIGVIIGGAFGKIVTSLVNDIVMPLIGKLTGSITFTELKYTLTAASGENDAVYLNYGTFIQNIVDFIIIAFCVFCALKAIMNLHKKKEEAPAAPQEPAPSNEEVLLSEIRDLLKEKK